MGDASVAFYSATRSAIEHELGGRLAGYAFVMTRGGQPIVEVCDGWARAPWEDDHPAVPFTADTRVFIASLSKPITLAGILRMISDWNYVVGFIPTLVLPGRSSWQGPLKGHLLGSRAEAAVLPSKLIDAAFAHGKTVSLDEPVLTFISSRLPTSPATGTDKITLRHLAGHRSGLDIGENDSFPTSSEAELWDSISKLFSKPMLASGPGVDGQPGYRNQHYSILRGVLDTVTGEDYGTFIQQTVLRPAGAVRASVKVEDDAVAAVYYSMDSASERVEAKPGMTFGDAGWGAGPDGWYASAREIANFWLAFHGGGLVGLDSADRDAFFSRNDSGIATYDEQTVTLHGHEGHWGSFDVSHGGVYSGVAAASDDGLAAVILLNGDDNGDWGYAAFAAAVQGALPVVSAAPQYQSGGVTIVNVLGLGSVRYTTNGAEPTSSSTPYTTPFQAAANTQVKAAVFDAGGQQLTLARHATIDHDTRASIAASGLIVGKTGLRWTAAAGSWNRVWPVASSSQAVSGESSGSDYDLAAIASAVGSTGTNFAVEYEGGLNVPADGQYTFKLTSDDGSRLFIDNVLVLDNDGLHPPQSAQATVQLAKQGHYLRLQFIQGGGGSKLELTWSGPGFSETALTPAGFLH